MRKEPGSPRDEVELHSMDSRKERTTRRSDAVCTDDSFDKSKVDDTNVLSDRRRYSGLLLVPPGTDGRSTLYFYVVVHRQNGLRVQLATTYYWRRGRVGKSILAACRLSAGICDLCTLSPGSCSAAGDESELS